MTTGPIVFTQRSARSPQLTLAIGLLVLVESVALHAFLSNKSVVVHAIMLAVEVSTVWMLYRHDQRIATEPVEMDAQGIRVRHGLMVDALVPWSSIERVSLPGWKDVPSDISAGYAKLSGMHDPNVLITCRPETKLKLVAGIRQQVRAIGLRLDEPEQFVEAAASMVRAAPPTSTPSPS